MGSALDRLSKFNDLSKSASAAIDAAKSLPIIFIPLDEISSPSYQARRYFDPDDLKDLSDSIRKNGVMQPILVRRNPGGKGYERIFGERRCRACKEAGLNVVPSQVIDVNDAMAHRMSIDENTVRRDISSYEKALGVIDLAMFRLELSRDDVVFEFKSLRSKDKNSDIESDLYEAIESYFPRMKPESFVKNILPLIFIEDELITLALFKQEIEPGYAVLLSKISKADLPDLLAQIKSGDLTIQRLRDLLPIEKKRSPVKASGDKNIDQETEAAEEKLSDEVNDTSLLAKKESTTRSNDLTASVSNKVNELSLDKHSNPKRKPLSEKTMSNEHLRKILIEVLSLSANIHWTREADRLSFDNHLAKAIEIFDSNIT